MIKLELKKMSQLSGGSTGSMCFWSPFRAVLGGTFGFATESGIMIYCWNS